MSQVTGTSCREVLGKGGGDRSWKEHCARSQETWLGPSSLAMAV